LGWARPGARARDNGTGPGGRAAPPNPSSGRIQQIRPDRAGGQQDERPKQRQVTDFHQQQDELVRLGRIHQALPAPVARRGRARPAALVVGPRTTEASAGQLGLGIVDLFERAAVTTIRVATTDAAGLGRARPASVAPATVAGGGASVPIAVVILTGPTAATVARGPDECLAVRLTAGA
jgi:hypothetical protein